MKTSFLLAYAGGLTVAEAAESIGFSPGPVYRARHLDGEFASAWAELRR